MSRLSINWPSFAEMVRLRKQHDAGVRPFARDIGIKTTSVYRALRGKPLETEQYLRVCDHLNIDPFAATTRDQTTEPNGDQHG